LGDNHVIDREFREHGGAWSYLKGDQACVGPG
jgi:hypothetical protein